MASISTRPGYLVFRAIRSPRATSSSFRISSRSFSSTPISAAYASSTTRPASTATSASPRSSTAPARPIAPKVGADSEPLPPTARNSDVAAKNRLAQSQRSLTDGLSDIPPDITENNPHHINWTQSYHGLGSQAFTAEQNEILTAPVDVDDVEVKPDGILYLPEIKYRRILNKAFGPGGWGLAPRGESIVTGKLVTREYGLIAQGRLVSIARGEQQYFDPEGISTATEGCKSNALVRCCKDLGIASELWDPKFIRKFIAQHTKDIWVEHVVNKKKKKIVVRKDDVVRYPFKESRA